MKKKLSTSKNKTQSNFDFLNNYMGNQPEEEITSLLDKLTKDPDSENNLEYDLRTTDWILEKVRSSQEYAEKIYATLCNNVFIKNDKEWSCSWRYSGGILADMREYGDYMDFYCSGNEGHVFESVEEDLLKLGWKVKQDV